MDHATIEQLFTPGNALGLTLLGNLRSSIAYVKEDNTHYRQANVEAAWTCVMARLGRGRAGKYGWNSRVWTKFNRTDFVDFCERNGISVVTHGRVTVLVDNNA